MTLVRSWVDEGTNPSRLLPPLPDEGGACLLALQVTTSSPLGALAYESGGLLVDDGWVRVLGGGSRELTRTLASWNGLPGSARAPGLLLVGDDALGGFFAIDGGRFGGAGTVHYFAPDTLEWEDLEMSFSAWLRWLLQGDLHGFYEEQRWPEWRNDVRDLGSDRAFSIQPFPCLEGPPMAGRSRRAVPITELWQLYVEELAVRLDQGNGT